MNIKTHPLTISASEQINVGERIYVLSNPKGLAGTISTGIVSGGIRRSKDTELLQIDAPISPGSSGGAVLNASGEVIGIATASLSGGQNLNFAVPSSRIKLFLAEYDSKGFAEPLATVTSIPNTWKVNARLATPNSIPPNDKEAPNTNEPLQKPKVLTISAEVLK